MGRKNASRQLFQVLRNPSASISFSLAQWDQCLRQARKASVLGRLSSQLEQEGLLDRIPQTVRAHLDATRAVAFHHKRTVCWEVNRLERVLLKYQAPIVLLKGAAYLMASLPPARGRHYSDVDIMAPKENLAEIEKTLLNAGWEAAKLDAYDQRYYRTWMHELPPLQHRERKSTVDLHHNILPETGRLHPDPRLLMESAREIPGSMFKMLAPADMVLHSAAHMFQDGELAGSIRDLTDLDDLLRHFGAESGFWHGLAPRSQQLDLGRPLYYALRYCREFLGTPIPEYVIAAAGQMAPPGPLQWLMDSLVRRSLIPDLPDRNPWSTELARLALYVRSHWLRMPPILLARHLLRKSLRRFDPKPA